MIHYFLSEMLPKMSKIMEKINPDAIFILGDTNSGLASYVAKRKKYQFFITRLEIDVLISVYLRN